MNDLLASKERLRFAVHTLPGILSRFSEAESEQRPSPERWSRKEVLGHLIDSASNNHQRFVRGQLASGQDFPSYDQEQWVRIQQYQSSRWANLIDLWRAFNTHILHVAECMSEEGKRSICRVGGGAEVTLAGLFVDYVDHLEHHLRMILGRWDSLRWEIRPVADLTTNEQAALRILSQAVHPPENASSWPGRAIEWSSPQWSLIGWEAGGKAICHVGVILREGRCNERAVKIGGIGGVKTHPESRRRGFAGYAIQWAIDFLRDRGDVDFGLLVCESALVPYYERLGWQKFPGELLVTQKQVNVPFTFNLPMTIPSQIREPLHGTIDLMGPPW